MASEKVLIHIGSGDDRTTYSFEPGKLLNVEYMEMEKATGLSTKEILLALPRVSMIAATAVVWILRRRTEPGLEFEDVQFPLGDFDVEYTYEEQAGPKESETDAPPDGPEETPPEPS